MAVAQSRRKDAPTQTTANARMRDSACPKFRKDAKPKEQARFDNPATLSPAQQAGYYFWCGGRENPQLAGRAGMLTSNNLYNFSSNVLTNYNNILQNPFKFVILYQKTKRPREPKVR